MADHKSTLERIRQGLTCRLRNRYASRTSRTMIKQFHVMTDRQEAEQALPKVYSTLDHLARKNIIHHNEAANLKSKVALHLKSPQSTMTYRNTVSVRWGYSTTLGILAYDLALSSIGQGARFSSWKERFDSPKDYSESLASHLPFLQAVFHNIRLIP